MKQFILLLLTLVLTVPMFAQEAVLDAPEVAPSAVKIKILSWSVDDPLGCKCANVKVVYRDASEGMRKVEMITLSSTDSETGGPTVAARNAFEQALNTSRVGETGNIHQKFEFRILGHLVDVGKITGVTLIP